MTRTRKFLGIPDEFWIGFIIMVGFFLKLIYDIELGWMRGTPNLVGWADGPEAGAGHIGLIQYYFRHHFLPPFSSRELACYSNPPLYYITSSLFMEFFRRLLGWSVSISLHLVQSMNVIYVMVGEACGIGIVSKIGVRGRKMLLAIVFLIFFPTFYHLSGAMDGSAMAFMYMMLALNSALSWYASRRGKALRNTAIEVGLGLLTSPSCLIVLPPILYLIRAAASDGRRNETPVSHQVRRFALTVGIMGLLWPVYQLIRFGMPPFAFDVSALGETAGGIGSRLALPDMRQLLHLHTEGSAALESNIWAQLLKTSVFDFRGLNLSGAATRGLAVFLLFAVMVLGLVLHLMLIHSLLASKAEFTHSVFLMIGEASAVAYFVIRSAAVPMIQTMDFKTIAPVIIYPVAGMALCGGSGEDSRYEKALTYTAGVLLLVMAVVTAFLFGYYVK